jgi:hypothetical protein
VLGTQVPRLLGGGMGIIGLLVVIILVILLLRLL